MQYEYHTLHDYYTLYDQRQLVPGERLIRKRQAKIRQRADAQLLMTFCLKPHGALPAAWPARAGCSINRSSASRFRSTSTIMASFRSKVAIGILSSTLSTFSWALDKKQILTQYGHDATVLLGEETLATTTRPAFDFRSARCSFRCECWCHRLRSEERRVGKEGRSRRSP